MDFERAQQIINSDQAIEVMHMDKQIWIESLDPQKRTASVSADGETYNVPVKELIEAHPGFKVV